jgi:hypothetical protein
MCFDAGTNLYIPCAYALLTGKNEYLYCALLRELVVLLDYKWMSKIVVVDFEKALVNAVKYEFSESRIIGCYFHFKQALSKKMTKYVSDADEVRKCLDAVNVLTLVPHNELALGIAYVQNTASLGSQLWIRFWKYLKQPG